MTNDISTCIDYLGKFCHVDAGFMLKSRLITPYRGVWDNLKEY